jgi:hypothetical protein
MNAQRIFTSLFTFCSLAIGSFANDLEKITELNLMSKAVSIYRSCCDQDKDGKQRPKKESTVFKFVTVLREIYTCNYDTKGFFLYFPSSVLYGKGKHNGEASSFRLDVEGESQRGIADGTKKYVRLQLQNHTGTNNSYASILLPTDTPIHVHLLYFALQLSFVKYFDVNDTSARSEKLVDSKYQSIEDMEKYPAGKAHKPKDVYLDDPIFTERNKHTREKQERVTQKDKSMESLNEAIKHFAQLREVLEKAIKSSNGNKQKSIALSDFCENFLKLEKSFDRGIISKESAECIEGLKGMISEKLDQSSLETFIGQQEDSLRADFKAISDKKLRDIKHDQSAQAQKNKQMEEARKYRELPKKAKWF